VLPNAPFQVVRAADVVDWLPAGLGASKNVHAPVWSHEVTLLPDETTRWVLHNGDSLEVLKTLPDASVDSVVCDPPYGLSNHSAEDVLGALRAWLDGKPYQPKGTGFMGKGWDSFVPGPEIWRECFRVLKPGGHLLAFAGTRTQDLMGIAIRLAGFDCRDEIRVEGVLGWVQGAGFPKSKNVALSIDKGEGLPDRGRAIPTASTHLPGGKYADEKLTSNVVPPYEARTEEAQAWEGWGTALKPSHEPVLMFRKPLDGTVAQNVQQHGTGAINIDGCRVKTTDNLNGGAYAENGTERHDGDENWRYKREGGAGDFKQPTGRWPSNLVLCHTPSCVQTGTKTVEAPVINRFDDGMKPFGEGAGHAYTSTGGGTEEIVTWDCVDGCPVKALNEQSGTLTSGNPSGVRNEGGTMLAGGGNLAPLTGFGDSGGASRFFPQFQYTAEDAPFRYVSKVSRSERNEGLEGLPENNHPTVKPIELMRWLVRLVTPPGGVVLDPFNGSGSTGCAAILEGMRYVGIDLDASYIEITRARITHHELKARGGVKNPWTAPAPVQEQAGEPAGMDSLFNFDE